MKIIAREKEIKILKTIYESTNSEFLAVYGRRRVGKTYLIKNFFENKGIFFHITGTPRATTQQQLWNFSQIYSDVFNNGDQIEQPGSWQEAFHLLKKGIGRFAAKKIILFLDELPWLANKKSNFVEALSYFWNRFIENDPRIKLIVCGSAASWMIKNVIDNRGGLYNRITKKMRLQPFNLFDTERYLKEKKNVNLSRKQIVEIYMAIGGVASYLDLVTKGRSSAQIISDIFFDQNSPVSGEFDRIFQSLFTNSDLHKKIITTLAGKKNGINRKELFQLTGIKSGSVQTRIITELLESGFIARHPLYGNRKKDASIRLIDEYSAFYTKWFKEITNTRVKEPFRLHVPIFTKKQDNTMKLDVDGIPVVILCGGKGTRLREETEFRPKPMIKIGNRPILWHIMKIYASQGFKNFILALGYKGEIIKNYFCHYELMNNDLTIELGKPEKMHIHQRHEENGWKILLADTGDNTLKGGRLKRIEKYVKGDTFMMTYGDGLADINIQELLAFHKNHGKIATVTGVNPVSAFGKLKIDGNSVCSFCEKPKENSNFVNGGFFVFNNGVFDYFSLDDNCDLEIGPLEKIANDNQLMVYKHKGFWACMDTLRDVEYLNKLWNENISEWKIWC